MKTGPAIDTDVAVPPPACDNSGGRLLVPLSPQRTAGTKRPALFPHRPRHRKIKLIPADHFNPRGKRSGRTRSSQDCRGNPLTPNTCPSNVQATAPPSPSAWSRKPGGARFGQVAAQPTVCKRARVDFFVGAAIRGSDIKADVAVPP